MIRTRTRRMHTLGALILATAPPRPALAAGLGPTDCQCATPTPVICSSPPPPCNDTSPGYELNTMNPADIPIPCSQISNTQSDLEPTSLLPQVDWADIYNPSQGNHPPSVWYT